MEDNVEKGYAPGPASVYRPVTLITYQTLFVKRFVQNMNEIL